MNNLSAHNVVMNWILVLVVAQIVNCTVKFTSEENESIVSSCNGVPIINMRHILDVAPVSPELIASNVSFRIENYPTVRGYQFVNPMGVTYDGVCAGPLLTTNVIEVGPAVKDSSWFEGYAWKVLYVKGCSGSSGHIGWSFYKYYTDAPSFVFLVLRNSLDNQILETNSNIIISNVKMFTNHLGNSSNSSVINAI